MRTLRRTLLLLAVFLPSAELGLRAARFEYKRPEDRVIVWSPEEDRAMASGAGLHELDRRQMWRPRPGARVPWTRDELVNAAGWRGPEIPRERTPGALRIAVLGGSAVFGEGVSWRDTFSTWLVRILAARDVRAEVVNAGVIRSTVRQSLERWRDLVREYHPDLVVSAYAGESEYLQAPRCVTDDERIVTGLGLVPRARGPRLLDLRARARVLHASAWLCDVMDGTYWPERDFELKEERLARSIGTWDVGGVRRVTLIEFQSCIVTLNREVQADGARLMLLWIPRNPVFYDEAPVLEVYGRVLENTAESERIPLVFGRLALARAVKDGIPLEDLFLDGVNPSDCAHLILAQTLVDEILPRVPELLRRGK